MTQVHSAGIALRDLHVGAYNPRRTIIQDQAWIEFRASIKAQGINQALLVRRVHGKSTPYELVAGQRRYLAALEEFGPDYEPPIFLKDMTDEQAELASASENIDREDMSPSEEAEAAARVVARCNGDRKEAAKRLGWSPATLADRLKLMACSDKTRKALSERKITLGLAELMSGMTHAKQDDLLETFLTKGVPTVEEAKATIMALTAKLMTAIFDKTECGNCAHNSARQKAMFGNIDDGHCLNALCFTGKTNAALEAMAASLKDDFQIVKIVRPGDNYTLTKLEPAKVGDTQAQACRNCANFGAAVSGVPNKMGQVIRGLCFDVPCNQQKVKAHADELAAAAKAAEEQAKADAQAAAAPTGDAGSATAKAPNAKPAAAVKAKDEGDATVMLTNAVHEYRDAFYRGVLHAEFAANPARNAQFLIALIISGKRFNGDKLKDSLTSKNVIGTIQSYSLLSAVVGTKDIPADKARTYLPQLGAVAIETFTREELIALVKESKADLGKYFNLATSNGKEFLKKLTKNQICAIAEELGIAKAMGQTFRSLSAGKKDEFIESVTTVKDFDYQGKVPNVLKPNFSK